MDTPSLSSPSSDRPSAPTGATTAGHHHVDNHVQDLAQDAGLWPWCRHCLPFVHILMSQIASAAAPTATAWAYTSPSPDYICIPALVHRSILGIIPTPAPFATTTTPQSSPIPSEPARTNTNPSSRRTRGVKIACANCRDANKRCDEGRPCGRCIKHGIVNSCVNAQKKQRRRTERHTTMAVNVSADQVPVNAVSATAEEDLGIRMTTPSHEAAAATVHINVASMSYVDEGQDMTDRASHSSSTASPLLPDLDVQHVKAPAPVSNVAVHANSWPSSSFFNHPHFPTWGYGDNIDHLRPFGQHSDGGMISFGYGSGVFSSEAAGRVS